MKSVFNLNILRSVSAVAVLLSVVVTMACQRQSAAADDIEALKDSVINIYNLYINGEYDGYVAQMESLDGMPADYRKQMADLIKMRHRTQEEEHGGPSSCRVLRILKNGENYFDAYVEIIYRDSTHDDTLLPFVKVAGVWRLK